eukprot:148925_1
MATAETIRSDIVADGCDADINEKLQESLYVCSNESFIYSTIGDEKGNPIDDAHILYDIVASEILQLNIKKRKEQYVWCIKPVEGWIYLPEYYDDDNDDEKYTSDDADAYTPGIKPMTSPFWDDDENASFLLKIALYFRQKPFLPDVIIQIIQAILIESCIIFFIFVDVALSLELLNSGRPILFMVSINFIFIQYIIPWRAASRMTLKKSKMYQHNRYVIIGSRLFHILPIGIFVLIILDIYHWFECTLIKPVYSIYTGGTTWRNISHDELGYWKVKRVSKIFTEAIPQTVVRLVILISGNLVCSECTKEYLYLSIVTSMLSIPFWGSLLKMESAKHGVRFVEYLCILFEHSCNIVPELPAIEHGTEKVNWARYKFSNQLIGHVAKAINSPKCELNLLKISNYSIQDLDRGSCKDWGKTLGQNVREKRKLIVSRLQEEIRALFNKYDKDKKHSLNFEEFVNLWLDVNQNMNERCLENDVISLYNELADKVRHKIWMLDIKLSGSLIYNVLLDYEFPLQHAYECRDLKMISLLMAYGYFDYSRENQLEFAYCVSNAITTGKIREALCLCEDKGIPLVVRIEDASNLISERSTDNKTRHYVQVSVHGQQQYTKYTRRTANPTWGEDLLFILPFELINASQNSDRIVQMNDDEKYQTIKYDKFKIQFRVFDYFDDNDDDFIGGYKAKITLSDDTSIYYKYLQAPKLKHQDNVDADVGIITYRVFLNAVEVYKDHNLSYIDSQEADRPPEIFDTFGKEFYCNIWLKLINNDIDKMAIIKLRKICQDMEQGQIPGKILLDYTTSGIFDRISDDIKHIEWEKHIKNYMLNNDSESPQEIVLTEQKINQQDAVEMFLDIMNKYDQIMNNNTDNNKYDEHKLKTLFTSIDTETNMSQLMDILFDIKNGNIKQSDVDIKRYKCSTPSNCNILYNNMKTRQYRLLSRALQSERQYKMQNNMTTQYCNKMELLDLIHIGVFHEQTTDRRMIANERFETVEKHKLFQDKFDENNNLHSFQLFCEDEEYDSEGIYDDIYPDNDGQSNIYEHFKSQLYDQMNEYYKLKQDIFTYSINPVDTSAVDRNLIELDFGDHVIDWDVVPKFHTMKQEWLQNEFFPIQQDLYDSLYYKSTIIANQQRNKTGYNLSINDILCLKMYTDTNELQRHFRQAFRMSSDKNRRSQFIHWATN